MSVRNAAAAAAELAALRVALQHLLDTAPPAPLQVGAAHADAYRRIYCRAVVVRREANEAESAALPLPEWAWGPAADDTGGA